MPTIEAMCDYCDCRRMEPIAELSEDHDWLLTQAARIRAALRHDDEAGAAAGLTELLAVLAPHAEREERGLFQAMAADQDLAVAGPSLLADHRRLHGPVEPFPGAVVAFLDDLAAHIYREEHDVFPAATRLLPAAAWDAVFAVGLPAPSS